MLSPNTSKRYNKTLVDSQRGSIESRQLYTTARTMKKKERNGKNIANN
jgi:hypothetical protein